MCITNPLTSWSASGLACCIRFLGTVVTHKQTCMPINSIELIDLNRFIFSAKLIELIQFLLQASCSMIESIRFHKVGDWADLLWASGVIEPIQLIKNAKRTNEIDGFPKKVNNLLSSLIDLIESFGLFLCVYWVGPCVLSNMIALIDIFKLYRLMVIESIHFRILPRLSSFIWHKSYTSLIKTHQL